MITSRPTRRRTLADMPEPVSPGKKTPSRKSPSRRSPVKKSPGRKSPARKSPARKSPGRKKLVAAKKDVDSIMDTPLIELVDISKKVEEIVPRTLRPRARVAPSFSSIGVSSLDDDSSRTSRKSTRSITNEPNEVGFRRKSASKESTPAVITGITEENKERAPSVRSFSREVSVARSSSAAVSFTFPREFGGIVGVLFLIPAMPLSVLAAHIFLTHTWNEKKPLDFLLWLWSQMDPIAIGTYFVFAVSQILITALPVGRLVDGPPDKFGRWRYRCNGLIALILIGGAFGVVWSMKWTSFILRLSSQSGFISMIIGATLWGILMSLILLIKSAYSPVSSLNPAAITRSKVYNFFMGRQISPRMGGVIDFKFSLQRISLLGLASMNAILVYGALLRGPEIKGLYPLLLCVSIQLFYVLDHLWFEDQYATSFTAMYEGGGYLLTMSSALYPFVPSLMTRSLAQHRLEYPTYSLCIIAAIYLLGYIVYRGSNAQKNEFRKNPMNPSLAHLEVIPTMRGKKLLVTGWWGWIRHPNYFGDIIIQWSWMLTCGLHSPVPLASPVFTMFALMYRAYRDDHRCRYRYGAAWERYCERVPYRIFPGIY